MPKKVPAAPPLGPGIAIMKKVAKKKGGRLFALYNAAKSAFETGPGRPTNQNELSVQKKTRDVLDADIAVADRKLTTAAFIYGVDNHIQLSAMDDGTGGTGMDMAHRRSADEQKHLFVDYANFVRSKTETASDISNAKQTLEDFTSGYISSDAKPSDKQRVRQATLTLLNDPVPQNVVNAIHILLPRTNKVSRMLAGGKKRNNRRIGNLQDPVEGKSGLIPPRMLPRLTLFDLARAAIHQKPAPFRMLGGKPDSSTI